MNIFGSMESFWKKEKNNEATLKNRLRLSLAISHPWSILYYKNIVIGRIPEYIQNSFKITIHFRFAKIITAIPSPHWWREKSVIFGDFKSHKNWNTILACQNISILMIFVIFQLYFYSKQWTKCFGTFFLSMRARDSCEHPLISVGQWLLGGFFFLIYPIFKAKVMSY